MPTIYVNNNYGSWASDRSASIERCIPAAARKIVQKEGAVHDAGPVPHQAAFFGPLRGQLVGVAAADRREPARRDRPQGDTCLLFTAATAHMPDYDLWVPADADASSKDAHDRGAGDHGEKHEGRYAIDRRAIARAMAAARRTNRNMSVSIRRSEVKRQGACCSELFRYVGVSRSVVPSAYATLRRVEGRTLRGPDATVYGPRAAEPSRSAAVWVRCGWVGPVLALAALSSCSGENRALGTNQPQTPPHSGDDPRTARYELDAYQLAQGGRYFTWYGCGVCHGTAATGVGNLEDSQWRYGDRFHQIYRSIAGGRGTMMPAYGAKIPFEQLWQITAYVRQLQNIKPAIIRRQDLDQQGEPRADAWSGPMR